MPFYSLWIYLSVECIPSAPSKQIMMYRSLLIFKMIESSFVFLQYPISLEIKMNIKYGLTPVNIVDTKEILEQENILDRIFD